MPNSSKMENQRDGSRQGNIRRGTASLADMNESHIVLVDLMQRLIKFDKQKIFRYPVNENLAPDYYNVIKNPMDFETMLKKLDEKQYFRFNEFVEDVRLIIENAKIYNAQSTIFYQSAVSLEHYLNKLWPRFFKKFTTATAKDVKKYKQQSYQTSAETIESTDNKSASSIEIPIKRKRGKTKVDLKSEYKLPLSIPNETIGSILGTYDLHPSCLHKLGKIFLDCQRLTKIPLSLSILIPHLVPPQIPMPSIEAATASLVKTEITGSKYTNNIKNFVGHNHLDKLYSIYPSINDVLDKFDRAYVSTNPLNDLRMFKTDENPGNYSTQIDVNAVSNLLLQLDGNIKNPQFE